MRYLFGPGAALVGRLRYAHKFIVVGLILLVPLGCVAGAYVQLQRAQSAFSAKECLGVQYMAPLVELTARVVEARRLSVARSDGSGAALDRQTAQVDEIDRRIGPELDAVRGWASARGLLVAAQRATGPAMDRYAAYNASIDALLALIVHVGDESNLTLDPDLDTYYLMDTLQFRLPVLLDAAGRGVDMATLVNDQRASTATDALIELGLANGVLASTQAIVSHAVTTIAANTADRDARRETVANAARLTAATSALTRTLTTVVKDRRVSAVRADAADAVRMAAAAFAGQAAASLDRLLRARIDGLSARAQRVELIAGLAGLLAAYLFAGFYRSVTQPIKRIVATLHAVADGDLTRRVSVDTHDELSFVARALNDTVATTEIATNRLARQATYDPLTGLPNRALVLDRLGLALARTARGGDPMSVLFIDLDRFKPINDSLGHATGDEVLRAIADRLGKLVCGEDTVARLAGDEFVVIGESMAKPSDAVRFAERVVTALGRPIRTEIGGTVHEVSVGASVGVAFADRGAQLSAEDLLRDADVAMYRAKQRGRGRVEVFDEALRIAVESRLDNQNDLRRAIEHDEIRAFYQPIVDIDGGEVVGFEALARWEHPVRGLLAPSVFIDVAEETGLIVPLGARMLSLACAQTARWRRERPDFAGIHVAVNVSGTQFGHPSFVPTVTAVLADTGLDPGALWLEITETSIMADAEAAAETLGAIRALGVHLAIDDFGTGYSSLTYLRRFPVETLKIDRSFVAGVGRDREDEAIVDMILGLARALGLDVVAEGVETTAQLAYLRRLGCAFGQGYHFGRPTAADEIGKPAVGAVR
ncbi:putative bifunctional diguanylate cyclase/phosphodiesterase [Actinoplanes subtropicus]|uniref:putative bifunctional diguanylate cyclase/phosphodiesterase n=1 Tax=Actinoplanes subtropicus TaxID=543632 RepID=UPI000A3EE535|nr:bifunctional diguanylate cyclase/phosphodiesterase [Actinoplanes subtropicus]